MPFTYLSPTSYIKFRNCEYSIYLAKVKEVLPKEEYEADQTMAMAAGSAFDIIVKGLINRRVNVNKELGEKILGKNESAIQIAKLLIECYEKGPLKELREEGIGYSAVNQEVILQWYEPCILQTTDAQGNKREDIKGEILRESVCYGMPDLVMTDGTVIDWKCQGMFGRGKIPINGYVRCYVYGVGHPFHNKNMGSSGKCDTPLEQIDQGWAIQTYLYSRLLGGKVGNPNLHAGIENICIDKDNTVYCASYRNPISVQFQLEVERTFHDAFSRLTMAKESSNDSTIEPPHASKSKCIQYNKLCPVAEFCPAYKAMPPNSFVR